MFNAMTDSITDSKTTQFILVRHGEIQANIEKRWHGWTDSPLTEHGHYQACKVGQRLANEHSNISAIYSSPLQRTRDTAEAIAQPLTLPVQVHDDLKEYGIGELEGETFKDLHTVHGFFSKVNQNRHFAPKGGESIDGVCSRVSRCLTGLASRHPGEKIVVVSHGAALALALAHFLDSDPYAWEKYQFKNTSVTELHLGKTAHLALFNCAAHIE